MKFSAKAVQRTRCKTIKRYFIFMINMISLLGLKYTKRSVYANELPQIPKIIYCGIINLAHSISYG